ncbi:MAG: hypothetical protein Q4A12_07125, partial [Eubacteriales bacterium]|nr:hypothetical protein [Eubacteriales bacterium]
RSMKKINKYLALGLAVLGIVAFVLLSFFGPKNVEGAWLFPLDEMLAEASADEAEETERAYYVFDEADDYGKGTWRTYYDGGVEEYEYQLIDDNGVDKINLGNMDLLYEITGSKFFGTAELVLTVPASTDEQTDEETKEESYVLTYTSDPAYDEKSYDEYDVDDELIGEWATNERFLNYFYYTIPYEQQVEFTDDGIMIIHYKSEELMLDRYMYYAYTTNGKTLTFSLVTDLENSFTVDYVIDDSKLKFTTDDTSGSIFSDQYFSDVTYYRPDDLPEPTESLSDELLIE